MKDLAIELSISFSEISESLNRSMIAGLISMDKKNLNVASLLEFLQFGVRYVYPQKPGPLSRGIKTAHSAAPLCDIIASGEALVWPYGAGDTRGQTIEPLHPRIPEACLRDNKFYELMALVDAIRVGRARERNMAVELLKGRVAI